MSVGDVFPRRNLPGSAEDWGRAVEGEVRGTQRSLKILEQGLAGQNRTFASSLEEISRQLNAISEQQNALIQQQAFLASRKTSTASTSSFNTGTLPDDATYHEYGPAIPITVAVPRGGTLIVSVGCGQATLQPDGGGVIAEGTFTISGGIVPSYGSYVTRAYASSSTGLVGMPLIVMRSFAVPEGSYTVTAQFRAWASGASGASVNFISPFLTVQVTV